MNCVTTCTCTDRHIDTSGTRSRTVTYGNNQKLHCNCIDSVHVAIKLKVKQRHCNNLSIVLEPCTVDREIFTVKNFSPLSWSAKI